MWDIEIQDSGAVSGDVYSSPLIPAIDTNAIGIDAASPWPPAHRWDQRVLRPARLHPTNQLPARQPVLAVPVDRGRLGARSRCCSSPSPYGWSAAGWPERHDPSASGSTTGRPGRPRRPGPVHPDRVSGHEYQCFGTASYPAFGLDAGLSWGNQPTLDGHEWPAANVIAQQLQGLSLRGIVVQSNGSPPHLERARTILTRGS